MYGDDPSKAMRETAELQKKIAAGKADKKVVKAQVQADMSSTF